MSGIIEAKEEVEVDNATSDTDDSDTYIEEEVDSDKVRQKVVYPVIKKVVYVAINLTKQRLQLTLHPPRLEVTFRQIR